MRVALMTGWPSARINTGQFKDATIRLLTA